MLSEFLRLRTSTETVVIGLRAALGAGNTLCRVETEEEMRRWLIEALADSVALDSLRRFWARWHGEPIRVDVTTDRMLIDRVISAALHGPLSFYVVPDSSVKHVYGPPGGRAAAQKPGAPGSAAAAPGASRPGASESGGDGASGGDPAAGLRLMKLEERLELVLDQAVAILEANPRAAFTPLREPGVIHESAEVLSTWARGNSHGAGLIIDALVVAAGRFEATSAIMESAKKLHEAVEKTGLARTRLELDAAVKLMAAGINLIGAPAFITAIRRGVDRVDCVPAKGLTRQPVHPVRPLPQRILQRPPPPPPTVSPQAKLPDCDCLKGASKAGSPFVSP